MRYRFAGFEFDPADGLSRSGIAVPLEPQSVELLHVLLQHNDRIVSRDELNERIWGGRVVSEASLSTQIRALRRALGDDRTKQQFIKTYPKRGFKFTAPVELDLGEDAASAPTVAGTPRRRRHHAGPVLVAAVAVGVLVLGAVGVIATREPAPPEASPAPGLSIAVLPFDNLSGDPSKDYLADAFTEDLVTDLSRIRDAFVISRSTTFTYRDRAIDAASVADELDVRYVLEGSLRFDDDSVTINAQLIDGESNSHLWSDRFERDPAGLFEVQGSVTGRIASTLRAELRVADNQRQSPEATDDAWTYALRGNVILYNHESIADYQEAHRLLTRAVTLDPSIASAWGGLAFVHFIASLATIPGVSQPDSAALSLEAAQKAVEADPMNAEPYWLVGAGFARNGQPERGMAACETAMQLNPNMDCGHVCAGLVNMAMGEPEKAVPYFHHALALNPLFRPFSKQKYLGLAYIQSGRYKRAIEALNQALAKAPKDGFANLALIGALVHDDRPVEAEEAWRRFLEIVDHAPPTIDALREQIGWMGPEVERLFEGLRAVGMAES